MLLGAHEGIAGGVSTAFVRAEADGCECLQIFTRNARGWAAKPLEPDEIARFRAERRRTGFPVAAHASYLVNAAAADREVREKSWSALAEELGRCEALGVPQLIFHPGSHADEAEGIRIAGDGMAHALERSPGKVRLLVETTAGQGASLGWRFEQLAALRAAVPAPLRRRVGFCFDTCHVFAAGYDFTTPAGYAKTLEELDRTVGLSHVEAFHLNDAKRPLGSRVDRHEHIGQGALGLAPFRALLNDARFADRPGFLETEERFVENLAVLRSLVRR
ncbi:MAG TPA: deoxyribonuclease IV [Anaeromyxobacteraceae bacterium]|nr:deoxyribonuclease IV [Anaeromyxobacteraceae bacterium]